ncbi:MAG: hypothetical protein H5T86_02075 [Armatimonadetes bacterium]|nr:hypothetical protein [Armatimonadota bacterium]
MLMAIGARANVLSDTCRRWSGMAVMVESLTPTFADLKYFLLQQLVSAAQEVGPGTPVDIELREARRVSPLGAALLVGVVRGFQAERDQRDGVPGTVRVLPPDSVEDRWSRLGVELLLHPEVEGLEITGGEGSLEPGEPPRVWSVATAQDFERNCHQMRQRLQARLQQDIGDSVMGVWNWRQSSQVRETAWTGAKVERDV